MLYVIFITDLNYQSDYSNKQMQLWKASEDR